MPGVSWKHLHFQNTQQSAQLSNLSRKTDGLEKKKKIETLTSILNFAIIWNTVTDHFVDTGTHRFGKVIIIQWRWITIAF